MKTKITIVVAILALAFGAQAVLAECFIGGTVTASPNPDPMGPVWMYTMVVTWDTGNNYSMSHANLLMDTASGTCMCIDFKKALDWDDPSGSSDGVPMGCTVDYQTYLECHGDPSIPGLDGIMLKLEPIEDGACEPGPVGTVATVFYSNLDPVPINEEALSVVDKYAQAYCFGYLSGDFPAMDCNPVANEDARWGNVKGLYR